MQKRMVAGANNLPSLTTFDLPLGYWRRVGCRLLAHGALHDRGNYSAVPPTRACLSVSLGAPGTRLGASPAEPLRTPGHGKSRPARTADREKDSRTFSTVVPSAPKRPAGVARRPLWHAGPSSAPGACG